MNAANATKQILGGTDGKARCQCGKLRYPRYKLCPKCYYEQKVEQPEASNTAASGHGVQPRKTLNPNALKKLSRDELLKLRTPTRMPLSDRSERVRFLEQHYGKEFRGQEIRYMKNPQLYAISQQAGYRRG